MNKFTKRLFAAATASTMFISLVTPAFAETTIVISGNGYESENEAEVEIKGDTSVMQSNNAFVVNNIDSHADTGDNDVNQNTGGDAAIMTGDAKISTSVSNMLNSNAAQIDCCAAGDTEVLISGNGAKTENEAEVELDNDINIYQDNFAKVKNYIDAEAETGENDANQNTGGGVYISTGKASTIVEVSTTANANEAYIGGGKGTGSISVRILDNGYKSENEVELELDQDTLVTQDNSAHIVNDIDADAQTGENDAHQNTGGDVLIGTGKASTWVEIDNMVNFNSAEVDCGCVLDLLAKIDGNGAKTENEIELELKGDKNIYQGLYGEYGKYGNFAHLFNNVDGDSETGENDANQNGGNAQIGGDPGVLTGDALYHVAVENMGNVNTYGADVEFEMPQVDFSFDFHFNLSDLLGWLGLV